MGNPQLQPVSEMIVDSHVHLIRPFDSLGRPQVYTPGPGASAEDYVALMRKWGIDRAFYISWSPEDIPSDIEGKGLTLESVRDTLSLDYALEVMHAFAKRFYWFPCHLGPSLPGHLETARANLELGAAGMKLVPSFWGELPDDRRLISIYDLADEYGAQIILDTSFWYLGKDVPAAPETLPAGHREVAKRITDFQDYLSHLRPVVASHPDVNFSLAHGGARNFTAGNAREAGQFIREYPNLYADLGALASLRHSESIASLVESAGEDRIMFGTDWPHFAQGDAMGRALDSIRCNTALSRRARRTILGKNALRFVEGRAPGLR